MTPEIFGQTYQRTPHHSTIAQQYMAAFEYKKGIQRPYFFTKPLVKPITLSGFEKIQLALFLAFTVAVRFFNIQYPNQIVFDEVHFGKYARNYINSSYFMDVHPPLVKMLYAAIGYLGGYRGDFVFNKIGDNYIGKEGEKLVPYVLMRSFPAICGVLIVILSYFILRYSGCRHFIALFGALLVCIENSLVAQSRFILLDSPLLLFIVLTVYSFVRFSNEPEPFGKGWIRYLFFTGVSLGLSVSSKWVGIFTIGWLGVMTVNQLWWLIGDLSVPDRDVVKHVLYRAYFLIILPVIIYFGVFAIHFLVLHEASGGSGTVSPRFKASLDGTDFSNLYANVSFGSTVSIRHLGTGEFLHSHNHTYPKSHNQQVTLYGYKDSNNLFTIEKKDKLSDKELFGEVSFLRHRDVIRLFHKKTQGYLHVSDSRPPISEQEYNNEVSIIGDKDYVPDVNENFEVKIIKEYSDEDAKHEVKSIGTVFQLFHKGTKCTLFGHRVKLPKDWGFGQLEVTCIESPVLKNSLWYIEENTHPLFNQTYPAKVKVEPLGFFGKFLELHQKMWKTNAGLTASHKYSSRPEDWPVLDRGVNYFNRSGRTIYLLGNLPIYWGIVFTIGVFVVFKLVQLWKWKPNHAPTVTDASAKYDSQFFIYFVGWLFHFAPSFLMERQLFLHHYIPSLWFGIISIAVLSEYVWAKLGKIVGFFYVMTILGLSGFFFYWYAPIVYGLEWNKDTCLGSRLLPNWDIPCDQFQ